MLRWKTKKITWKKSRKEKTSLRTFYTVFIASNEKRWTLKLNAYKQFHWFRIWTQHEIEHPKNVSLKWNEEKKTIKCDFNCVPFKNVFPFRLCLLILSGSFFFDAMKKKCQFLLRIFLALVSIYWQFQLRISIPIYFTCSVIVNSKFNRSIHLYDFEHTISLICASARNRKILSWKTWRYRAME